MMKKRNKNIIISICVTIIVIAVLGVAWNNYWNDYTSKKYYDTASYFGTLKDFEGNRFYFENDSYVIGSGWNPDYFLQSNSYISSVGVANLNDFHPERHIGEYIGITIVRVRNYRGEDVTSWIKNLW